MELPVCQQGPPSCPTLAIFTRQTSFNNPHRASAHASSLPFLILAFPLRPRVTTRLCVLCTSGATFPPASFQARHSREPRFGAGVDTFASLALHHLPWSCFDERASSNSFYRPFNTKSGVSRQGCVAPSKAIRVFSDWRGLLASCDARQGREFGANEPATRDLSTSETPIPFASNCMTRDSVPRLARRTRSATARSRCEQAGVPRSGEEG